MTTFTKRKPRINTSRIWPNGDCEVGGTKCIDIEAAKMDSLPLLKEDSLVLERHNRRMGWFADTFGDELFVPAVWYLPNRRGYMYGYRESQSDYYVISRQVSMDLDDDILPLQLADTLAKNAAEIAVNYHLAEEHENQLHAILQEINLSRIAHSKHRAISGSLSERAFKGNDSVLLTSRRIVSDKADELLDRTLSLIQKYRKLKEDGPEVRYL